MLTGRPITPVLPVTNLERSRRFYAESLGLRPASDKVMPNGAVFQAGGGTKLELLKRDRPINAEYTALSFEVEDIEREVKELESRGVRFEDYDQPGLKTEQHIARMNGERAAWFKDPDGNILCIHEIVKK